MFKDGVQQVMQVWFFLSTCSTGQYLWYSWYLIVVLWQVFESKVALVFLCVPRGKGEDGEILLFKFIQDTGWFRTAWNQGCARCSVSSMRSDCFQMLHISDEHFRLKDFFICFYCLAHPVFSISISIWVARVGARCFSMASLQEGSSFGPGKTGRQSSWTEIQTMVKAKGLNISWLFLRVRA